MNVLVTGGTGFIGGHVVRRLRADGHHVRCLVRSKKSTDQASGAEELQGSFDDLGSLARAVSGMNAVVHLVGIISETRTETFEKVHVESTRRLLDAAGDADVRRWLQMSALGTRPNAVARYHRSKWAAEELVRASGMDWTIFRPSIVLGEGSGFERTFKRIARWSPVIPIMGPGTNLLQPVRVEEVALAFSTAVTSSRLIGRTVNLCGETRVTFCRLIDQILGRSRRIQIHIPMNIARVQATFVEWVFNRLLDQPSPLTKDQLVMLEEDNVGDSPALASAQNVDRSSAK